MFSLHQTHVADELYSLCGNNFRFFEMRRNVDEEKASYVEYANRPYLVRVWEGEKEQNEAMKWALNVDVARFSNDESVFPYLKARLDENLLSFEAGERWLKKGMINLLSPRLLKNIWHYYTLFRNKPLYKLCASAYTVNDQYLLGTFKNRCYKWGYFTKTEDINVASLVASRKSEKPTIMWCARFLRWKHPELVIHLARRLKDNGYDVQIDMFGGGHELRPTMELCQDFDVQDMVSFKGNVPNDKILQSMRNHDVFLFTSDRNEGWGAVLNEAMSNGCTVVASNEIGSTPYLIDDWKNGLVFKSNRIDSLYEKVTYLIDNPSRRKEMAIEAYKTMKELWSPHNAALNFIQLSKDLINGHDTSIEIGPCSKACLITV